MMGMEVVKLLMTERKISNKFLAEKLNYKTPSGVSERLRGSQDMRADTLAAFLAALDCELVIKEKTGDKREFKIG